MRALQLTTVGAFVTRISAQRVMCAAIVAARLGNFILLDSHRVVLGLGEGASPRVSSIWSTLAGRFGLRLTTQFASVQRVFQRKRGIYVESDAMQGKLRVIYRETAKCNMPGQALRLRAEH